MTATLPRGKIDLWSVCWGSRLTMRSVLISKVRWRSLWPNDMVRCTRCWRTRPREYRPEDSSSQ